MLASVTRAEEPARTATLTARTRLIALIVSGTFFIEQLDSTIIATALPQIATALDTRPVELNLAMTAYLLGLAIFVPISGRMADRFGPRDVFGGAVAVFLLGSLLCGASTSVSMFVGSRFLQGIGGAMMAPVGRLIVLRTATRQELVEAMALVLLPAMIAPMIGPLIGGVIATLSSWRWIFLVNVPLGALAIAFILRHVDNARPEGSTGFDLPGTVLTALGFAAATIGVELLADVHLKPWQAGAAGLVALGSFGLYWRHFRRHPSAVLDLGLATLHSFRWSMISGSLYRVAVGGVPFLLPVALQVAYGFSAIASGAVVLLPAVGGFAMKFLTTRLLRRFGYRRAFVVNGLISTALLAGIALASPGWPWTVSGALLVLFGLSRSLHMNAYGTIAYADVPKDRMAAATSFFLSVQNLTVGLGVAFSALAVRFAEVEWPQSSAALHFSTAFALLAACSLLSTLAALKFEPTAGADLLGRPAAR